MSHFTRVKTVIRDQVLLQDTLRQLHYRFQAGEQVTIRGYQGNSEHGQVVVDTGSKYDIGFQRQSDESFAVCADWWGGAYQHRVEGGELLAASQPDLCAPGGQAADAGLRLHH